MAERTFTIKHYEGTIPRFKGYETFKREDGSNYTVNFAQDAKLGVVAKDVPFDVALRLHRSEAFDIIDPATGKVPGEFFQGASPHGARKSKMPEPEEVPVSEEPAPGKPLKGK
jgi:hypothetical protein